MNIFLITPSKEITCDWKNTLKVAVPSACIIPLSRGNWSSELNQKSENTVDIIIIINFLKILNNEQFIECINHLKISIICIDDDLKKFDSNMIMEKGIKATADKHISISKINELIRIVTNGGIYIESSNK